MCEFTYKKYSSRDIEKARKFILNKLESIKSLESTLKPDSYLYTPYTRKNIKLYTKWTKDLMRVVYEGEDEKTRIYYIRCVYYLMSKIIFLFAEEKNNRTHQRFTRTVKNKIREFKKEYGLDFTGVFEGNFNARIDIDYYKTRTEERRDTVKSILYNHTDVCPDIINEISSWIHIN